MPLLSGDIAAKVNIIAPHVGRDFTRPILIFPCLDHQPISMVTAGY